MVEPIVIVHGWSDEAASFIELAKFLSENLGVSVEQIDLADWLSLNDEVTYMDLREAMNRAWLNNPRLKKAAKVNVVSHSTGALVVRSWMTHFYEKNESQCPIKRHLMLAPANFGSPLAHKGKKFYGRLFKGFQKRFKYGLETGTHLLHGLELASPFTWDLAEKDVFSTKWYGKDNIMATVLVGNRGYGGVFQLLNEEGSDGTVRVSTANLNAAKLTVYFDEQGKPVDEKKTVNGFTYHPPKYTEPKPASHTAFGVIPQEDHGSITQPKRTGKGKNADWDDNDLRNQLILEALRVQPSKWDDWKTKLKLQTDSLYEAPEEAYFHGYQNTVLCVYDTLENPVEEYVVQFKTERTQKGFSLSDWGCVFHQKIIRDVHNFRKLDAYRSFYLDITALEKEIKKTNQLLSLNIDPHPEFDPSANDHIPVGYPNSDQGYPLDAKNISTFFAKNRTLLIQVYLTRLLDEYETFRISPAPEYEADQKKEKKERTTRQRRKRQYTKKRPL